VTGPCAHVVPLLVGAAEPAARIVEYALEQGVFCEAVLPPGVPDGAARLRLAVMASHTRAELREAAAVLARAALRAGVRPGAGDPVAVAQVDDLPRAA
jgi:7-keto-8-aminopelargonate synthetase-like enzyme